jgi:hypothetical protein
MERGCPSRSRSRCGTSAKNAARLWTSGKPGYIQRPTFNFEHPRKGQFGIRRWIRRLRVEHPRVDDAKKRYAKIVMLLPNLKLVF